MSVQNYCVRLVLKLNRRDHITPHLQKLGWLNIENFVKFRLLCITHQAYFKYQPKYLSDLITSYETSINLRSQNKNLLKIPYIMTTTGRKSFSYQAPVLWNSLPQPLREISETNSFKNKLKLFLLNSKS